jgi:hypothetical protein
MNELLVEGNLAMADEVLAPDYVNLALGGGDVVAAEGDAVFARFNYMGTLPDGSTTRSRGLAYYRLADGKIVVNDVMFVPDLMQVLGGFMASGAQP